MSDHWEDYYSVLQVNFNADPDVITGAYRLLSKKYHPDINKTKKAEETMKRINVAYDTLSDARKRALYNIEYTRHMRIFAPAPGSAGARTAAGTTPGTTAGTTAGTTTRTNAGARTAAGAGYAGTGNAGTGARHTNNAGAHHTGGAGTRYAGRSGAKQPGGANTNGAKTVNNPYSPHIQRAREQILSYYRHIKEGNYDAAYDLISAYDKNRIKRVDFIKWRETVAKSCELRSCDLEYFKTRTNMHAEKKIFNEAHEFTVQLCERDIVNNKISDFKTTKFAVNEDGEYGVYLGYANLKAFIAEYERRDSEPVDKQAMLEHWHAEQSRRDQLTGLFNLYGFNQAAKTEVSRYTRNDCLFSIAIFEIVNRADTNSSYADSGSGSGSGSGAGSGSGSGFSRSGNPRARSGRGAAVEQPLTDEVIAETGHFFQDTLRDIDISCRWKDGKFIALLAETEIEAAKQAINRICSEFNRLFLKKNKPGSYHALYAGVSEYDSRSISSTLKKCSINLALAKLGDRPSVIGVFTRLRMLTFVGRTPRGQFSR